MPNPVDQLRSPLRSIRTFADLVRYLEDELDWPLQEYGFDELTFEYSPAELGLKDEDAAKVKTIHQLRPVVHGQPFGIFFVEFERKRMPVVVLRRILSHLVLKKRASANRAGAAAWNLDDLLFISAFGDEASDQREIAFAHFWADPESPGDLPVLKVLGWDDSDTILHVADAEKALREHLHWPDDTADLRAWRDQWASAFTLRHREVIETTAQLVEELARLATAIRRRMNAILASESDQGPIRRLHSDFRKTLIHDLSEDDFADVVAQTITYGLLAARFSRPMGISVHDLPRMVPPTNPFLRDLLEMFLEATGHTETLNFDELGIQDVVELLNRANADAVKDDFGNRTRSEDPVVHFYEHFLKAYDARRKIQRGVFYTPQPVVSYIVRSVHELLQTEFGIEDGLASTITWGEMKARHTEMTIPDGVSPNAPFVVVLDPATGTGTFLVEVIEVIFRTLMDKWTRQRLSPAQRVAAWNAYVPEHLFPRLFGYELMMAPYAIAHMKLGLKLSEINTRLGQPDYQFKFAGRAHIYLTNALEPPQDFRDQFAFVAPALAHEAQAVNAIKRGQRFTVVIGNPPYSKISANLNPHAVELVESFRYVSGNRVVERGALALELNLQDDYVKFWGLLRKSIADTGTGIASFITNSRYLASRSLRGMRWSFRSLFTGGFFVDLGGQVSERGAVDAADENVFDIEQGVAVGVVWKRASRLSMEEIRFGRVTGTRVEKYRWLEIHTISQLADTVRLTEPFYRFSQGLGDVEAEFNSWPSLEEIMPFNSGSIITSRDNLALDFDKNCLLAKINRFALSPIGDQQIQDEIGFSVKPKWDVEACKASIRATKDRNAFVRRILYRPFDWRWIYYSSDLLDTPSRPVCNSVFEQDNLVLLTPGINTTDDFCHAFVAKVPAEKKACSHDRATQMFPLFRSVHGLFETQVPNLAMRPGTEPPGMLPASQSGESAKEVFSYLYAILHSPEYRSRYGGVLRDSYPRIPFTHQAKLFKALTHFGGTLVALHLMESPVLAQHVTTYIGPATPEVEKVSYGNSAVWVDKAQTVGFRGVPEAVWNFHIGGYQVCDKWLKDRKGRTLSAEDIEHYQRVVVSLNETIRIMGEIDAVIEAHGGWPIQ